MQEQATAALDRVLVPDASALLQNAATDDGAGMVESR
jgi:hypothetical protein